MAYFPISPLARSASRLRSARRRLTGALVLFALAAYAPPVGAQTDPPSDTLDALEAGFREPPVSARPKAYWDWTNGNVSLSQITYELEEARRMGMGGFDIWDVGVLVDPDSVVPAGPPFLSDASVAAIGHAVREGTRLGLELGLVISSSWNAGGTWVPPEHGAVGLFRSDVTVEGPGRFDGRLPFPDLPALYDDDERRPTIIERDPQTGLPTHYQDVAVLAHPLSGDSLLADPGQIIDLTERMGPDGRLSWAVPEGRWRITRYVSTGTGQPLMVPSPNSRGLMLDHFSAPAMAANLDYIIGRLAPAIGPFEETALDYLYTDSYEVNTAIWTSGLPEAFYERNGYRLVPYLPALDGFVVESPEVTDRFLYDFGKTLSDLIIENHYAKGREISHRHGLKFYAEAGGPGPPIHNIPFEDLKALGALDVPRGEFWNRHPRGEEHQNQLQIVKGPASAAHQYDQPSVEAEAFTSTWLWQEGPAELKPLADRAFTEGLSRIVYHTFPHVPPEAGEPGWVYNFGTLVYPGRVWWPKSEPFHGYLARTSFMLQQGHFVGDVLYYYGDRAPNFVTYEHPKPPPGYDFDVTNSDVILNRMEIEDGQIVLPHGQRYEILVLPHERAIRLEVLERLEELVKAGLTLVGPKPERSLTLKNRRDRDQAVQAIAARMWGDVDSARVQERPYGEGRIVWGKPLEEVLRERGLGPDVRFESDADSAAFAFIHRRVGADDVYFVRNGRDAWADVQATFRLEGKVPERWDPVAGRAAPQRIYRRTSQGTEVPLKLGPYGSTFVVFRSKPAAAHVTALTYEGSEDLAPEDLPESRDGRLLAWRDGAYRMETSEGTATSVEVEDVPAPTEIGGPWEVSFPHGWGAPASMTFPELVSWTDVEGEAVRHFSGIAAYHNTFEVPPEALAENRRVALDLGDVREVAEVWVNGRRQGILWHAPYAVDVTDAVLPGQNHLVVEVANVLNNRLVGDAKKPEAQRRTKSNVAKLPSAWKDPWAEAPLKTSGLLGPVRLRFAEEVGLD